MRSRAPAGSPSISQMQGSIRSEVRVSWFEPIHPGRERRMGYAWGTFHFPMASAQDLVRAGHRPGPSNLAVIIQLTYSRTPNSDDQSYMPGRS